MTSRLSEIEDFEVVIDLDHLPPALAMADDASLSSESSGSFTRKRPPSRSPSSYSTNSEGRGSLQRSSSSQDPHRLGIKSNNNRPLLVRGISKQTLNRINSMTSLSPRARPTDSSSFSGHTARSSFSSTGSNEILQALEAANRAVGEKGYPPTSPTDARHRRSLSEVSSSDLQMTTREPTEESAIPPLLPDGIRRHPEYFFPSKEYSSDTIPTRENSTDSALGPTTAHSDLNFRALREFSNDSGLNGDDEQSDTMSDKSSITDGIAAIVPSGGSSSLGGHSHHHKAIPLVITIPFGASSSAPSTPSHTNHSTPTNTVKPPVSSPSMKLYKKLSSQALDLLACESRDSEEELRLLSDKKKTTSFQLSEHFDFNGNMGGSGSNSGHHAACIPDQPLLKIVLVGDESSGKTSLLRRHFDDQFSEHVSSTAGVDFRGKTVMLEKEYQCKVQLWDTAGASKLQTLTKMYYKGAHVFGIVFDLTKLSSVEKIPSWIESIRKQASLSSSSLSEDSVPIILIGNKVDADAQRKISAVEVEQYAKSQGLQGYVETSAKTGEQVPDLIEILIKLAFQRVKSHPDFHVLFSPVHDPWSTEVHDSGTDRNELIPDAQNTSYHSLDSFLGELLPSALTSGKSSPKRPSSISSSSKKRNVYHNSDDEDDDEEEDLFLHAKFDSMWAQTNAMDHYLAEEQDEDEEEETAVRPVEGSSGKELAGAVSPVIPASHRKQSQQCQCSIC